MKFWDSSAVVPLLVEERATARVVELSEGDPDLLVWWATELECVSAISRLEREDLLGAEGVATALDRLRDIAGTWFEVEPSPPLRDTARRLLRTHPLRAADALQIAAAIVAEEGRPGSLEFVSLDERLRSAAQREGFDVVA